MTRPDLFSAAAGEGIITKEQADRLRTFADNYGAPVRPETAFYEDDAEAPRFIRGFHDILVTIGVVLGLVGLGAVVAIFTGGFAAFAMVAVAAVVLSEYLVRGLRLALPAVALSIAFTLSGGAVVAVFLVERVDELADASWASVAVFVSAGIAAALYFARYRVPFALALLVGACGAAIISGYLVSIGSVRLGLAGEILVLVLALGVFALALGFDFSDPERRTRRSDYAFWLHLIAAPALIGSVMNMLVGYRSVFQLSGSLDTTDAMIVLAVMLAMCVLAILIDRRAFLVAGLGYFGAAIATFTDRVAVEGGLATALTVLIVGAVILVLALGWQNVRRWLIGPLPRDLTSRLPPVRVGAPVNNTV